MAGVQHQQRFDPYLMNLTLKIFVLFFFVFFTERVNPRLPKLPLPRPAPCHPASVLLGVRCPLTWPLETPSETSALRCWQLPCAQIVRLRLHVIIAAVLIFTLRRAADCLLTYMKCNFWTSQMITGNLELTVRAWQQRLKIISFRVDNSPLCTMIN